MEKAQSSTADSGEVDGIEITKVLVTTPLPLCNVKTEPNPGGVFKRAAEGDSGPQPKRLVAAPLTVKPEPLDLDGISTAEQLAARIAEEQADIAEKEAAILEQFRAERAERLNQLNQLKASQELLSQAALMQPLQPVEPSSLKDERLTATEKEAVVDESEVAFVEEIVKGPRMSFKPDYVGMLKLQREKKKAAWKEVKQLKAKMAAKDAEIARVKAKADANAKKACEEARAVKEKKQKTSNAIAQLIPLFGEHNVLGLVEELITIELPDKNYVNSGRRKNLVVSTKHIAKACQKHLATLDIKNVKLLTVTSCKTIGRPKIPKQYRKKVTPLSEYMTIDHSNPDLHPAIRQVGNWLYREDFYSEDADVAKKLTNELPVYVHTREDEFETGEIAVPPKPAEKPTENKRKSLEDERNELVASIAKKREEVRSYKKLIEMKKEKIEEEEQQQTQE